MSAPVMLGITVGAVLITLPIIAGGAQIAQKHEAQKVADAAALAAADAHLGWISAEPCSLASRIAEESGFEISACDLALADVSVNIRIGVLGKEIRARAGNDL